MWALLMTLFVCSACLASANGCDYGSDTLFERPPSILDARARGVDIWTEVSSVGTMDTYVVHERYDNTTKRSFLEFYDGKTFQKIIYDSQDELLYNIDTEGCATLSKANSKQAYGMIPFMKELRLNEIPAEKFIGPAALFERFTNGRPAGRIQENDLDRLIPSEHYRSCDSDQWDYYYSTGNYSIFGQTMKSPLRVVVSNAINVEILAIKQYSESDVDFDIFIPTGLSCENPKRPVDSVPFMLEGHEFVGEVVVSTKESPKVFTSTLEALIIPSVETADKTKPGIYSFTFSTWMSNENKSDYFAASKERLIHDVDHKILYETTYQQDRFQTDLESETCVGFRAAGDYKLTISIPFFGTLDLSPLFLQSPTTKETNTFINYLGPNKIRSKQVEVYEVTIRFFTTPEGKSLSKIVYTFYVREWKDNSWITEAVEVNAYQGIENVLRATFHITQSQTKLEKLNEKLDVESCYSNQDKTEYRWFQIGLQLKDRNQTDRILSSANSIHTAFVDTLYKNYHISPLRIPKINIDFFDEQVKINTLIVERPLLEGSFQETPAVDFVKATKVVGIMAQSACLSLCLSMRDRDCTAVSYCGSTCSISDLPNPTAPVNSKTDIECAIFSRSADHGAPVTAEILRDLQQAVTNPEPKLQFTLDFAVQTQDEIISVQLIADSFDQTSDYDSAFNYDKKKKPVIENKYNLVNPRKRFQTGSTGSKNLGSLSLDDCALSCNNREECETFSYCDNSGECLVSSRHSVDISQTVDDNHCVIYQTKYVDHFERFPGLTFKAAGNSLVAVNPDVCAQYCLSDASCKSFDYCEAEGNCVLLPVHITDSKDFGKTDSTKKCSHFSKKYLYDYTKKMGTIGTGGDILANETSITESACAKLCTEWADPSTVCLSFDFCGRGVDNTGSCTLRTIDGKGSTTGSPSCDFFHVTAPKPLLVSVHGAGAAFGMSILMIVVGVGVGAAALFGYSKYSGM